MCRYICKVNDQGFRIKVKMLKSMAESLLITRQEKKKIAIGVHWVNRYLQRNPEVAARIASTLERQRVAANNPATVKTFCRVVEKTRTKHKPPPQNI